METINRSRVFRLAMAALLMGGMLIALSPAEAHAACQRDNRWTSTSVSGSHNMNKSSWSTCNDLNGVRAHTRSDDIRGRYWSGGQWRIGTAGWQRVNLNESNWAVLLSTMRDGALMRGQARNTSQTVTYMH